MNLTPWYPPHIKPVRVGVYETDSETEHTQSFQHWDGKIWGMCSFNAEGAKHWADYDSWYQSPSWRGLAHPPK